MKKDTNDVLASIAIAALTAGLAELAKQIGSALKD